MDGKRLTHLDDEGRLKMIDIDKVHGARGARARWCIQPTTAALIAKSRR